eukprot:COSAG04_NODE_5_length_50521_cov_24.772639_39_plen_168_part_00
MFQPEDDSTDEKKLQKWGMCTSIKTLRDHRAELMAVRDIIVDGHAWTVYKLLRDVDGLQYSCALLQEVLRNCSGYQVIREELDDQFDEATIDADYINKNIRPSILTLSIINKLLGEVEHETAKKEKLEVTLILSFLTGLYTLVHWFFTELWDIDDQWEADWHNNTAA